MNRIEPIGPTPVRPVERRVERRDDEAPPKRDQHEQPEQPEPEEENGLDVRV